MGLWQNEYVPTANRMIAALLSHTDWGGRAKDITQWSTKSTGDQTVIEVCGLSLSLSYRVERSIEWVVERESSWCLTAFGGGAKGWADIRLATLDGDREQFERDAMVVILSKQEMVDDAG